MFLNGSHPPCWTSVEFPQWKLKTSHMIHTACTWHESTDWDRLGLRISGRGVSHITHMLTHYAVCVRGAALYSLWSGSWFCSGGVSRTETWEAAGDNTTKHSTVPLVFKIKAQICPMEWGACPLSVGEPCRQSLFLLFCMNDKKREWINKLIRKYKLL